MDRFGAGLADIQDEKSKHIELRTVLNRSVEVTPHLNRLPEIVTIYTRRPGEFTIGEVEADSVTINGSGGLSRTFPLSQIRIDRS